jgi:tetratricopeptide (TPR) repeat protein
MGDRATVMGLESEADVARERFQDAWSVYEFAKTDPTSDVMRRAADAAYRAALRCLKQYADAMEALEKAIEEDC